MRYRHIFLTLLLSCMLLMTLAVNDFVDGAIVPTQPQKEKSQPVAPQKTTPVSPVSPISVPPADGQITNVTTRPASGLWHTGTPVEVQWQWPGYTNRPVDVTLWSGTTQVVVIISRWPGQSVGWNVPYNIAPGPYKVRVQSSNNNRNFSEATVNIELCKLTVTSPTQADKFLVGSSTTRIAWTFTGGNPGPLKLELVPSGGGNGQLIADKVPWGISGLGQYSWQVPGNTNPGNYQIRITSMGNSVMTATSQMFSLDKFGRATITVTDDSNHRFVSVPVSVTVNGVVQTVATDGNGNAKFTQLQPGRYTFTATLVGGLADGSYTVDGPATVVVTAGANQWGTIKLRRLYGNIEIIVRDAAGNLIDKAMNVTVVSGPSRYGWGQTSSWPIYIVNSGIARIKDVPIGAYQFSADMNPLMAQGHCYNNKKSGIVNVTAGATTSSTIIVFRCGQATVTVIDDTKAPVPVATVTIDGVTKTTDANGRATFDLQDGTHSIRASKGGYTGGTPQPVTVTLANSGNTSLAISIGTRQW